jgi:uncharacterized membrane protein YkvA (DUF1232 family)
MREWARKLKRESHALYIASRDSRTPWYAKALGALVVAYALSPIDLIPDFIPVLGYVDDLLIVPLGLALALRMIPTEVMEQAREQAEREQDSPTATLGAAMVVLAWLLLAAGMTASALYLFS